LIVHGGGELHAIGSVGAHADDLGLGGAQRWSQEMNLIHVSPLRGVCAVFDVKGQSWQNALCCTTQLVQPASPFKQPVQAHGIARSSCTLLAVPSQRNVAVPR